jgi:exopolysaccharide biosynthesis polyprenyl glycosylphosphotransferase
MARDQATVTIDHTSAPAVDLRPEASRQAVPPKPARAVPALGGNPRWLRAVDAFHRGLRSPALAALDAALAAGGAIAAGAAAAPAVVLALALVGLLYVGGKYADRGSLETQGVLWYAGSIVMPVALVTLAGAALAEPLGFETADALRFGALGLGALVLARALTWSVLVVARRGGRGLDRTLILGGGERGRMVARKLAAFPEAGLVPVAMIPLGNGHGIARFMPDFPSPSELCRAIREGDIRHVVLAPDESDEAIVACIKGAEGLDVSFSILPPLADLFLHPGLVTQVGGLPLIPLGRLALSRTTLPGKRLFDLVGASLLLVLLSPIMALTALAIRIFDGGPVIYRQRRVGRDGRTFDMLKFRSMGDGAERLVIDLRDQNVASGLLFKVRDDPRVTRVGRIIRRFSIDELPQLWNVIRGEMSLVGPRPLPVEPEDFGAVDNKRHTVLPGITGYWQIAGGHDLTYEEMIKLDLAYVQNWSLWLDVRLLLRTLPALLHRRGVW